VAAAAGGTSALVSTPAELLMIQQQRTGDSLAGAARRVVNKYGLRGLYRGFVSCL
jgi:Mitochondrial carrier protein